MKNSPRAPLGQFNKVTVWAMYFEPDAPDPATADLVDLAIGRPDAEIIALVADDRCVCGDCAPQPLTTDHCPQVERVAREVLQIEQERRPDQRLKLDSFTMPTYFTTNGQIREVVNQIAARHEGRSID